MVFRTYCIPIDSKDKGELAAGRSKVMGLGREKRYYNPWYVAYVSASFIPETKSLIYTSQAESIDTRDDAFFCTD